MEDWWIVSDNGTDRTTIPSMPAPDRDLGASGEKSVRQRLEMAMKAAAVPFSGFDDKGVDFVVQFEPNVPLPAPMFFGVQVKTGASFGEADGANWRLKNIAAADLDKWSRSNLHVILVWIRPGSPDEYLWTLVGKETNLSELRIARSATISPAIRYDLSYHCPLHSPTVLNVPVDLCRPPLGSGLRQHAKEYYRAHLMKDPRPVNPILGPVSFSWAGWHHLTAHGRKQAYVQSSLQMLAAAQWGIENPSRLAGVRRLPTTTRGAWVWESRLLAFECSNVPIRYRAPGNLVVVIKQEIIYPVDWMVDVNIWKKTRSSALFLSIYEKDPQDIDRRPSVETPE